MRDRNVPNRHLQERSASAINISLNHHSRPSIIRTHTIGHSGAGRDPVISLSRVPASAGKTNQSEVI